jgi:hypothetical protein
VRTLFAREPGDLATGQREKTLSGPHRKGEEP